MSSTETRDAFTTQAPPDYKDVFHLYASVLLLILVAALVGYLFRNLILPRKDFYNELWGPAYLLVHGQSPYDTAILNPSLPAAWLPMAIGFFFPLGWLPEKLAAQVWYVFNILEFCFVVYLAQGKKRNLYDTAGLALICFSFPLMINHIVLGQISITVALAWILGVYFLEKGQPWVSALFVALALSKPHLGFLSLLGLNYRDYLRGGFRAVFSAWARIFFMCLILCIPLFAAYPNWIPDAIVSMGKNPPWAYPSLHILFEGLFSAWGLAIWVITTLTVIGTNFWLWKKLPIRDAAHWSLALAPLTTPYVGSWDFVILLPLLFSTYVNVDWRRRAFLWCSYWAAWALMVRTQTLEGSHNYYFWWVPLWFAGTIALVTNWRIKRGGAS